MKIHSQALNAYGKGTITGPAAPRPMERSGAEPHKPPTSTEAAEIKISEKARELAAASTNAVDAAKVERLKAEIEQGNYRVNSQVLAMRLLDRLG